MSTTVPILQVRGNSVVVYHEALFSKKFANNHQARNRMKKAAEEQYSGQWTAGARKRLTKAVTLMCQATRPGWKEIKRGKIVWHHLSFVTLTMVNSSKLTAAEAYQKTLKHFFQWLRRTKEVKMYVCVVERQLRGDLHYHLVFPDYIDHKELRDEWNAILHRSGMLDQFAAEHEHFNPNSTQINQVRKKNDVAGYLVKELGKKIQKNMDAHQDPGGQEQPEKKSSGKVWYCSECFAGVRYFSVVMTREHEQYLNEMSSKGELLKVLKEDFWSLLCFDNNSGKAPPDLLSPEERGMFHAHLDAICNKKEPDLFDIVPEETIAAIENLKPVKMLQSDLFNGARLFFN